MARCIVYYTKPTNGPSELKAGTVLDEINTDHPTWMVTLAWNAAESAYSSAIATAEQLETYLEGKFPGYNFRE